MTLFRLQAYPIFIFSNQIRVPRLIIYLHELSFPTQMHEKWRSIMSPPEQTCRQCRRSRNVISAGLSTGCCSLCCLPYCSAWILVSLPDALPWTVDLTGKWHREKLGNLWASRASGLRCICRNLIQIAFQNHLQLRFGSDLWKKYFFLLFKLKSIRKKKIRKHGKKIKVEPRDSHVAAVLEGNA